MSEIDPLQIEKLRSAHDINGQSHRVTLETARVLAWLEKGIRGRDDERSKKFLIPGPSGQIRSLTQAELDATDAQLRATYTGMPAPEQLPGVLFSKGTSIPPNDISEIDRNIN